MATVKQTIARNTGAGSRATQYKKSAAVSARVFARAARIVLLPLICVLSTLKKSCRSSCTLFLIWNFKKKP